MKKLLLLVGLFFFISLTVEGLETIFNTDLPKCKTIKNKKLTADQKRLKKLGRNVVLLDKIETTTACYGEIIVNYDCTYKGEFQNRIKHGYGELSCSAGSNTQLWEKGKLVKNYSSIELRELKIELGIIKTVKEEFYCESISGNVYKTPIGCINNISITEKEYAKRIAEQKESDNTNNVEVFCYNKELKGQRNSVMIFKNKCNEKRGWEKASQYQIDKKLALMNKNKFDLKKINKQESEGFFTDSEYLIKMRKIPREAKGMQQEKKTASFDELSIALGCGIKRNDKDDCVKRYLAFFLGTGPMTMEEVDEIKKDKLVMGEIVKAIEEMHIANNQSQQEPTEEEKAFAQAQEQGLINNQNFYKMYDPILEKHLNSRGWTQVNPKLEKILNSMGRSQVPVKHQKRFTIRAGNLNYNF